MHKKLLVPVALIMLTSVGLCAMDEQPKDKQDVVAGLSDLEAATVDACCWDEYEKAHPQAAQLALEMCKQRFMQHLNKNPNFIAQLRTKSQTRSGLTEGIQNAGDTLRNLKEQADAAKATAAALGDMFKDVTGVDVNAVAIEAGADLKSLVQQGVEAALAGLKEAEQTGCWGKCKKKSVAAASTTK